MRHTRFLLSLLIVALLGSCYHRNALAPRLASDESDIPSRGEQYNEIIENPFISTSEEPTSTFSVDADGGAYSNVRRLVAEGTKPPTDAIRIEEFINYFPFNYADPTDGEAIALNGEIADCPWTEGNKLIRIGIKGESFAKLPTANFVLLVDVSGSMEQEMELVRDALSLLAETLRAEDRIAIVTYSGKTAIALPSTSGNDQNKIQRAIRKLKAGGSTAGGQAIVDAYDIAVENYVEEGNNRIIMVTDGDFNVGISDQDELIALIEEKRDLGVFLTTIGVGSGNYQEGQMEQLANHGNGTYEYLDGMEQAEKLFVHEASKLYTVAKDVKVQVTFNPELVASYRLIGYENRALDNQDFENDSTDAGEIGAGQTVTALYEIVPASGAVSKDEPSFTILFRYKSPHADQSRPLSLEVTDAGSTFSQASENLRFAAALASMGMLMRESEHKGDATWDDVRSWMQKARGYDPHSYRAGAIQLLDDARPLYE